MAEQDIQQLYVTGGATGATSQSELIQMQIWKLKFYKNVTSIDFKTEITIKFHFIAKLWAVPTKKIANSKMF